MGHSHEHSHHDQHDHAAHAPRSRLAFAGGLTALFMIAEVIGGVISGSLSLLADAAHMLTDTASLWLAWFGFQLAERPADTKRSYGFSRFRILAAFANGLTLIILAGWITVEAVQRLMTPGSIDSHIMLSVAGLGLGVNVIAFFILHGGDAGHGDVNLEGALWHVATDMFGSVAAIAAAFVIMATGWTPIDPLLSVFVAALAAWGGYRVIKRSGHILLEGAPTGFDSSAMSKDLNAMQGVSHIHHVHVWTLNGQDVMVTLHVCLDGSAEPAIVSAAVKERLRSVYHVDHATIEIDEKPTDEACNHLPCPAHAEQTAQTCTH